VSPQSAQHAPGDANAAITAAPLGARRQGFNLFLVGFLVLFLELACIRWFAAHVIFLQFFTNVVLIACFLGMSCGCLAARQRRDWLDHFPALALAAVVAALAMHVLYQRWSAVAIDVGNQASAQEVFFGTEYRNPDVAQFAVPIELIAAGFFVLIALLFVGLGQVLGRAFDAYPDRVRGYTLNIGGSLAGIVGFSLISFVHAPPVVWFLICCAGIAYLLTEKARLTPLRAGALAGASGSAEPLAPRFQVVRSSPVRTAATLACPPVDPVLAPHGCGSEGTGSPRCTGTTQPGSDGWTRGDRRVDC